MAGILTVLKIIGIVLLWILAILLFLLLLVLFVPVRYTADVNVPETELDKGFDVEKIHLKAGFSWLLHFISGGIEFPEDKQFTLKILGIKVFPRKKKEKDNINKKDDENIDNSNDKDNEQESDKNNDSITTEISYEEKSDMGELEEKSESEEQTSEESEKQSDEEVQESDEIEQNSENCTDNSENEPEDKALIEIITDILEKIENILKTPQTVLRKIQYTISRVCDKIGMIKTTLENDIFKRAFSLVKRKFIRLLKMILPDKIRASVLFGTGDPADTAEVMALYSAFYTVLYDKVQYEPDFDRKVVRADAHVKGHITLFTTLYCVAVCYFNKDVKKTIKRFQKIIKS